MNQTPEAQYLAAWDTFREGTAAFFELDLADVPSDPNVSLSSIANVDDLDVAELIMNGEEQFDVAVSDDALVAIEHINSQDLTLGAVFGLLVES